MTDLVTPRILDDEAQFEEMPNSADMESHKVSPILTQSEEIKLTPANDASPALQHEKHELPIKHENEDSLKSKSTMVDKQLDENEN